jgi:hypothetical protein
MKKDIERINDEQRVIIYYFGPLGSRKRYDMPETEGTGQH